MEDLSKIKLKSGVRIGDLKISKDFIETGKSNIIGNEILEKLNPIIDYKHGKFYLKKVDVLNVPMHGKSIAGLFSDGKLRVAKIWNPYLGKTNIGDEILEIDEEKPNFENNCFLLEHPSLMENAKKVRLKNAKTGEEYFLNIENN